MPVPYTVDGIGIGVNTGAASVDAATATTREVTACPSNDGIGRVTLIELADWQARVAEREQDQAAPAAKGSKTSESEGK